jgi:hypothetical protein
MLLQQRHRGARSPTAAAFNSVRPVVIRGGDKYRPSNLMYDPIDTVAGNTMVDPILGLIPESRDLSP